MRHVTEQLERGTDAAARTVAKQIGVTQGHLTVADGHCIEIMSF